MATSTWDALIYLVRHQDPSVVIPTKVVRYELLRRQISEGGIKGIYARRVNGGTILTSYDSVIQPLPKVPETIKLQYAKYMDGKTYRLHYGIDFTSTPEWVFQRLHKHATSKGLRLYSTWCTPLGWIEFRVAN